MGNSLKMSRLLVNNIRAYSGSVITIPATTKLSLGGKTISQNSVLPSASGQTNKAVGSDGSSIIYNTFGATNMQVFTSSGTYVKTSGTNQIMVRLVGGGGGGSGHCESGGAAGFSEKIINVSGIVQYLLLLEQEVQELITLEDLDKVLHPHLDLSCQQLEEMVPTNPINTQEDLEVLEAGGDVNMYGGGGSAHGQNKWCRRI